MSHDAPVNTVPTQAAGRLDPPAIVSIVFDVADLDRTTRFYSEMFGFEVAASERVGLPYETRALVSRRFPGVALFARKTFQRPVAGSTVGSIVQIGLRDSDLAATIRKLEGHVTWLLAPSSDAARVSMLDPDGYIIELFV